MDAHFYIIPESFTLNKSNINELTSVLEAFLDDYSNLLNYKTDNFDFRRFHLGLFPGHANNYVDECKKYYPDFFFHDNNYSSIKPILEDFSQKIVYHLSALHDVFPTIKKNNPSEHDAKLLEIFSIETKLDETASLQGKSKAKKLKFEFSKITADKKTKNETLVCEPHMKLCKNNKNDGRYYSHRIYFHFNGQKEFHDGKILIAHIGKHR